MLMQVSTLENSITYLFNFKHYLFVEDKITNFLSTIFWHQTRDPWTQMPILPFEKLWLWTHFDVRSNSHCVRRKRDHKQHQFVPDE